MRVSTPEQSFELQRQAIELGARNRGDSALEWFAEKRSGRAWERPELDRLRGLVFAGGVRRLYVWKLDRFTRRGIADTLELVASIRKAGCELISITEPWDFTGPMGEIVLAVLGWSASIEASKHLERVQAARARLAAEGRPWGRPPRLDAELSAKIVALREQTPPVPFRKIAVALSVPLRTVVRTHRRALEART